MKIIRTTLDCDVDLGATKTACFSRVQVGLHFELLERVNGGGGGKRIEHTVFHFDPIQCVMVVAFARAHHGDARAGDAVQLLSKTSGRVGRYSRRELGQLQELAAVQGQVDDTLVLDDLADFCRL